MLSERIEINPEICNGKAVVRGTRITVDTILGYLSAGDEVEDILEGHPSLVQQDIFACLDYARRVGAARSVTLAAG